MKFRDMITLQKYRRLRTWTAAIALVGVGSAGTLLLQPAYLRAEDAAPPAASGKNGDTYKQLNLFGEVFEKVRAEYVEPVTDETLIENSINGMLSSLDPHSSYLNAKNYKDMQVQTRGEFGGLGIEVTLDNGVVKVVSPIDDTPASRAGVKPGDLIIQINAEPVTGLSLNELDPTDARTFSFLGEALLQAEMPKARMPHEARAAFDAALKLDPKDARARYYRAVGWDLSGQHHRAIHAWFALLRETPPDAPYAGDIRAVIRTVGARHHIKVEKRLAEVQFTPPGSTKPSTTPPALPGKATLPGPAGDRMRAVEGVPRPVRSGAAQVD